MKALIIGAGPAGLMLASSLMRSSSRCRVEVLEQRSEGASAGLGITLPLDIADETACAAGAGFPIDCSRIYYRGVSHLRTPIDLIAVSRDAMIARLRQACESAGVRFRFQCRLSTIREALGGGFDLIVGADGAQSVVRLDRAHRFGSSVRYANLHHTWLATPKLFKGTLVTMFQEDGDSLFTGWAYQFSASLSAVIIQASSSALETSGVHGIPAETAVERLSHIFAGALDGNPLLVGERLQWSRFMLVKNRTWHSDNIVLIGDAAHTAHFCRGYGTADALRDAVCLSRHIGSSTNLALALEAFERERMPEIQLRQSDALSASNWHERIVKRREEGNEFAVIDSIFEAGGLAARSA